MILRDALYHAMTGELIDGKTAAAVKLVNESVPLDQLEARVRALAEVLLKMNPVALKAAKDANRQFIDEKSCKPGFGVYDKSRQPGWAERGDVAGWLDVPTPGRRYLCEPDRAAGRLSAGFGGKVDPLVGGHPGTQRHRSPRRHGRLGPRQPGSAPDPCAPPPWPPARTIFNGSMLWPIARTGSWPPERYDRLIRARHAPTPIPARKARPIP